RWRGTARLGHVLQRTTSLTRNSSGAHKAFARPRCCYCTRSCLPVAPGIAVGQNASTNLVGTLVFFTSLITFRGSRVVIGMANLRSPAILLALRKVCARG